MTYKDAREYPYLILEIECIKDATVELECAYERIRDRATPAAARDYDEAWNTLQRRLMICEAKVESFENWILSIANSRIQTCALMRFVNGARWPQIGEALNCTVDAAKKALSRYIEREARRNP